MDSSCTIWYAVSGRDSPAGSWFNGKSVDSPARANSGFSWFWSPMPLKACVDSVGLMDPVASSARTALLMIDVLPVSTALRLLPMLGAASRAGITQTV